MEATLGRRPPNGDKNSLVAGFQALQDGSCLLPCYSLPLRVTLQRRTAGDRITVLRVSFTHGPKHF